ncbi:MAG TPA: NAD-dependent epimerase/dehydratase family protein [Arthrobacter sp.]|nr:NAD-dependent epimerase/dehydratase family protein [Arthrobacter sp.]
MRIVLAGASGLIGTHLSHVLREAGNDVVTLVRRAPAASTEVPGSMRPWPARLPGLRPDAVRDEHRRRPDCPCWRLLKDLAVSR